MRALIVEDENKIAKFVGNILQEGGFSTDLVQTAENADLLMKEKEYDVIVLDVMLPGMDGVRLTQKIRSQGLSTPILMLTALKSTENKVTGLRNGADDYLTKPFERDELLARVDALVRRGKFLKSKVKLNYDDLYLDLLGRKLFVADNEIELTQREFQIMELFLRSPENIQSRTQILNYAWDMNFDPESNLVDVYINNLREKLSPKDRQKYIKTVKNIGYVLKSSSK